MFNGDEIYVHSELEQLSNKQNKSVDDSFSAGRLSSHISIFYVIFIRVLHRFSFHGHFLQAAATGRFGMFKEQPQNPL